MALDFSQVKSIKISQFNQVDYLHFNGVDNYIDSGISFGQYNNRDIEFEFSVDSFSSQIWSCTSLEIKVTNSGVLKANASTIGNITINTKYKLVINHKAGLLTKFTLYQGETSIGSITIDSVTSTSMYFFAKSYPGTGIPVRDFSAGKLYSFKEYTYPYAPYKKISNGEIGLYSDHYDTYKIMAGTINNDSIGVIVPPTVEFPGDLVKKIEDSNGVVLWKQPQPEPEWHTIWQGSRDIGIYNGSERGAGTNFAQCANDTGYTPLIRITFSNLTANSNKEVNISYSVNNVDSSSKPYSPQEMTLRGFTSYNIFKVSVTSKYFYDYANCSIKANKDTSNNRITFDAVADKGGSVYSYNSHFTLTKIEQYY